MSRNIIRVFVLHSYSLLYPINLLADSEGPDQTAHLPVKSMLKIALMKSILKLYPRIYVMFWIPFEITE